MPLALVIEQCYTCSRIAGAPTTTSRERRHSRFFSHREGDIASRRAAPRRADDDDEEASRVGNAMHYAQHVRQHASPSRHAEPGVSLFLALTTAGAPRNPPYLIARLTSANFSSISMRIFTRCLSIIFLSIIWKVRWHLYIWIIYEYL